MSSRNYHQTTAKVFTGLLIGELIGAFLYLGNAIYQNTKEDIRKELMCGEDGSKCVTQVIPCREITIDGKCLNLFTVTPTLYPTELYERTPTPPSFRK